jgi:abortive infection bacteriophage resistance protein
MTAPYTKPWLSLTDQLQRLKAAGLIISDETKAANFLRHLNYYRFSGYGLAFEATRHQFQRGTTFEQIRAAYEFDRTLRDLTYESMEVVELDIRTSVAYTFGQKYGAFGHTDKAHFYKGFDHKQWYNSLKSETKRSSERFIGHFESTYSEYPDLPIWVVTEIMSFGTLSRMIEGMDKADVKGVASRYKFQPLNFISCLHHLVYVRNICAHHARLWDREWAIKPTLPLGKVWRPPLLPGNDRLFACLLLQNVIMRACHAEQGFVADWRARLAAHIDANAPKCPDALRRMGFTPDWQQHPHWQ